MRRGKNRFTKYTVISIASIAVGILFWWLATDQFHLFRSNVLPSPVKVAITFVQKWYQKKPDGATLLQHLGASLQVAMGGYLIGVVIGIPLGIFMAWNDTVDMLVRPVFDLIRTIPGIAWTSVMVTLVGIGFLSKALVIFISAMVAMIINSYSGIKQTKTVHLWVGQTFGASNWDLLTKVAIPSALPMIFNGLDVALGSAWTTLVAAELLASTRGTGLHDTTGKRNFPIGYCHRGHDRNCNYRIHIVFFNRISGSKTCKRRTLIMYQKYKRVIFGILGIFIFFCIWLAATKLTSLGKVMPDPITVLSHFFKAFVVPIGTKSMALHILVSLRRMLIPYIIGGFFGVVLGILMGWYKVADAIFMPYVQMLRPIPPIAWIPLSIIWFGFAEGIKIFSDFSCMFFYNCTYDLQRHQVS